MSRVTVNYMDYVAILVHRVLSRHSSGEVCPDCPLPCRHCGNVGKPADDHTCPCPHGDETCPDHPEAGR